MGQVPPWNVSFFPCLYGPSPTLKCILPLSLWAKSHPEMSLSFFPCLHGPTPTLKCILPLSLPAKSHPETYWLMITYTSYSYTALFSALLSRLTVLACGSTWVTSFIARFSFFKYPPKWCTYNAGMAGATWNCSRLGASPVYTIQPCSMSLHAKPHM